VTRLLAPTIAALVITTSMPVTVAILSPRALGGTWIEILGLTYLITALLVRPHTRRGAPWST
jgi:hypothetical protein